MGAVPPADDSAAARIGAGPRKESVGAQALVDEGVNGGSGCGSKSEIDAREQERRGKVDDGPWEGARIFVATSTSGLAASLRPEEKERIWKILGDWCVQRRKERAEDKTEMDA
ncbi:hypothetical protein CHU98_g364 [Xylaria longipes]|nr:hypothetical protein CHU98_g364 [Xylaria longipes]